MPSDRTLRLACAGGAVLLAVLAYVLQGVIDSRVQAAAGVMCFLLITAACSTNLRAVNFRTVAWGIGLQLALALFILKFEVAGVRPGYEFFNTVAGLVKRFLEFTNAGSQFVFGDLARPDVVGKVLPSGFIFAFTALPTIIFVSSFFTVL
jgi:CNT family concentrative nucleoside transporter